MKKVSSLLFFVFLVVTTGFAQVITIYPLNPSYEDVKGPVKQLTIVREINAIELIIVRQYDVQGRLTKNEEYQDGELHPNSYIRQYTDSNECWEYRYEAKGIFSEENYSKIKLDTAGRKIAETYFRKGKLFLKDSIVYDSLGRKIEDYQSFPKNRERLILHNTYEYDTFNRLIRMHNCIDDKWLTMTYMPNGNGKMHYGSNNRTYIVNSQGQLVKINERDEMFSYFSDFDQYGNWHRAKYETINGPIGPSASITKRTIEYYSPAETDTVYLSSEQLPEFPGGQKAMFQYISNNVIYPLSALKNGTQGRAVCQFVVNKSGDLADIVVVKSSGDNSLDQEAVRVLMSMPKWNPGRSNGEIVRVKYTVPVIFKIMESVPIQKTVEPQENDTTTHVIVDEMPEFPEGQQALFDYLAQHLKYPKEAIGVTGRAIVQFVVGKDGQICNVEIAKSSGNKYLDAEAIRLIKSMPRWKPGKLKGQPVNVKYSVSVAFSHE